MVGPTDRPDGACFLMKWSEYKELFDQLRTPEDIDHLVHEYHLDPELLLVVYTQRVTRDTMKKFYRVKNQVSRLAWAWGKGDSFLQIARRLEFPPVLLAQMVLEQRGTNRKQFWRYLADPKSAPNPRLRKELEEVGAQDIVYSLQGTEKQYERGRWGERRLKQWLEDRGVQYRTESQLRGEFEKTPDALLRTPLEWNGSRFYWIESKAIVGDPYEMKRHIRKQLIPYTQMFGEGIVVYWFGYVEDGGVEVPEAVTVFDDAKFTSPAFNPAVRPPLPEDFHRRAAREGPAPGPSPA